MDREKLIEAIEKSLDHIGLELRVWQEDYFGRKPEQKLVEQLADQLLPLLKQTHLPRLATRKGQDTILDIIKLSSASQIFLSNHTAEEVGRAIKDMEELAKAIEGWVKERLGI